MGGRGRLTPGGGRENWREAGARRRFERGVRRAAGAAGTFGAGAPNLEITSSTVGGGNARIDLRASPEVRSAAGGVSPGHMIRQADGRFRTVSGVPGARDRFFRSGVSARDHLISTYNAHVESRVGGAVGLTFGSGGRGAGPGMRGSTWNAGTARRFSR